MKVYQSNEIKNISLLGTLFFSLTTFFTSENSFAVFGVILTICLMVTLYFFKKSPEYWNETKAMFKKTTPKTML